jgi:hypothetical protein
MPGVIVVAVLVTVAAMYVVARVGRFLSRIWFLGVLWRWHTGVSRSERLSRPRLAAWRNGATLLVTGLVAAAIAAPRPTAWGLAVCAAAALGYGLWRAWRPLRERRHWLQPVLQLPVRVAEKALPPVTRLQHYRKWMRPAHLAACNVAQIPAGRRPSSWLEVAYDRSWAKAQLPPGWPADDKDKQRLIAILTAKLGMEADAAWRLAGPKPVLELTVSQPPPDRVTLADIMPAIEAARPDEAVWGLGRGSAVVKTSLSADSPHYGMSEGSGAGKSIQARGVLAQGLYHGCVGLILDHKLFSHQWAQGLPNVVIAREPEEIHEALLWLGGWPAGNVQGEVKRRAKVALAGSDMEGNVHATVGARLIVVCEELNATMTVLRAYWRQLRNEDKSLQQRSPALDALDQVNLMGRQVKVNIIYMGQRLSVKAVGGDGDARESIGVLAFGRYSPSNWKMLAPDFPMPPSSRRPGRIQVVSDHVRETQAAYVTAVEARELALAGTVTPCPAGMPGRVAVPGETHPEISGADLPFVPETRPHVLDGPQLVTLAEAVELKIVSRSLHALRKASQRDPDFPQRGGWRGNAAEYDAAEINLWDAGRR